MRRRSAALAALVLVIGGAVVAVQRFWPEPGPVAGSRTAQVTLPATGLAAVPVCPGPQTLVVPSGSTPLDPGGPVAVGAVVDGRGVSTSKPATLAGTALPGSDGGLGVISLPRTSAGSVPLQPARAAAAPPMSAVQFSLTRRGDLRGLSALACGTASTSTWLVGGATSIGHRGNLLLANPAATPAQVDVTVYGPKGAVRASGGTGVVVPAEGIVALRVDALAPELDAVAVRVQSRSGRVSAVLHDSYVRGLTPGGVDDIGAAAPPARRQIVPGLDIVPLSGTSLPMSASAPGAVAVRVVNPGATEAVATVRLVGHDGPVDMKDAVLTLEPGQVEDLALTGVERGVYTAVVDADAPVVAGAVVGRTVAGGQAAGTPAAAGVAVPPSEFAWAASAVPLAGATLVAVPELSEKGKRTAVGAVVTVAAPNGAGGAEVVEYDAEGRELSTKVVLVTAGSSAEHALSAQTAAVRLRPRAGSGPLTAAFLLSVADPAGPMLSVLPIRSGPTGSGARPHVVADPRTGLRS